LEGGGMMHKGSHALEKSRTTSRRGLGLGNSFHLVSEATGSEEIPKPSRSE